MKEAGFKYELHKKSYYVDRHEDDDVVSSRNTYIKRFFADEIYEHCFIQISKIKYQALMHNGVFRANRVKKEKSEKKEVSKNLIDDASSLIEDYIENEQTHFYKDEDGKEMVEIHVDHLYTYDNDCNKDLPSLKPFGGNLSVRLPKGEKPRIVLGQDEAIYRSSQQNESCWTIDGETTLRTKGLGTGVMVSAFVSRELGFGIAIKDEDVLAINKLREGKKYTDEEAASYLLGSAEKKPLQESPFVRFLNYGTGKDGYWTYRHMVLQIEDCTDCL